jgi:Tripartite tricarboxylate transporter TctB family
MENRSPYLNSKVVVPAVMLLAMIGYLTMALEMGTFFIGNKTGEAFFPLILGLLGVPLSIWILYEAVAEVRKSSGRGEPQQTTKITTPLILTAVSFLYIVAFYYIGLIPALLGYVFLFMVFFDDSIRQLFRKFIYSTLITGVIYVLYALIFRVQFDKIFFG